MQCFSSNKKIQKNNFSCDDAFAAAVVVVVVYMYIYIYIYTPPINTLRESHTRSVIASSCSSHQLSGHKRLYTPESNPECIA